MVSFSFYSFLRLKEIMPLTQGYIATNSKENGIPTKTASACNAHALFMQYHIASTSITIKAALLFSLFAEARAGKEWAGKLEEDARSQKNCRHVSSLLTGIAALTVDMLYSLVVDPEDMAIMLPTRAFQVELI